MSFNEVLLLTGMQYAGKSTFLLSTEAEREQINDTLISLGRSQFVYEAVDVIPMKWDVSRICVEYAMKKLAGVVYFIDMQAPDTFDTAQQDFHTLANWVSKLPTKVPFYLVFAKFDPEYREFLKEFMVEFVEGVASSIVALGDRFVGLTTSVHSNAAAIAMYKVAAKIHPDLFDAKAEELVSAAATGNVEQASKSYLVRGLADLIEATVLGSEEIFATGLITPQSELLVGVRDPSSREDIFEILIPILKRFDFESYVEELGEPEFRGHGNMDLGEFEILMSRPEPEYILVVFCDVTTGAVIEAAKEISDSIHDVMEIMAGTAASDTAKPMTKAEVMAQLRSKLRGLKGVAKV